jgi:hypothetical protein
MARSAKGGKTRGATSASRRRIRDRVTDRNSTDFTPF